MVSGISGLPRLVGLRLVLIAPLTAGLLFGASPHRTENIVLVTADGLRWQEVFGGIDKSLMHAEKSGHEECRALA